MFRFFRIFCLVIVLIPNGASATSLTPRAMGCIAAAASYHRVNPLVLQAIARHESGGNPRAVVQNANGSIDVGLVGINSIHFPALIQNGVTPDSLLDECVSIYVGAWKLAEKMAKHGDTWTAIGAYHSETPEFNQRYQMMIYKELMNMGVLRPPSNASSGWAFY